MRISTTAGMTFLIPSFKKNCIPRQSVCTECEKPLSSCIIKCSTCKELLCGTCDLKFHFKRPFHVRELFNNKDLSSRFLLPEEFIGVDGIVKAKAVPVPLFVPSRCINCREHGTFSREAGSKSLAIITKEVVLIFTRRRFVAVNARTALKHQMKCTFHLGISHRRPRKQLVISPKTWYYIGITSST